MAQTPNISSMPSDIGSHCVQTSEPVSSYSFYLEEFLFAHELIS